MLKYKDIKPSVYIETTVVSYLVARPSADVILSSRQQTTRQLWEDYSDNFEFVVSDVVITEIRQGDEIAAQRRIEALAGFTVLIVGFTIKAGYRMYAGHLGLPCFFFNYHWKNSEGRLLLFDLKND